MTNTDRLSTALADRYRIVEHLGEGGMATVYLAEDLKHDRKVAVKVLRPELAAVLGAERFVQEIKTTASLQHPHILPLFDSGQAGRAGTADSAGEFLFYVMPYIEGETLRDKLNRETQLGIDEAVRIASEVADALDYAHRHGVIHRDIKPENILLHDGRPMVADFGIALAVSAAAGGRMTETGLSLGTPHYMSPEQATADKDITNRSDIYSIGSVLFEMLTGEPPHLGNSAQQIIMKIVTDEARPVHELRKSVPENVAAAVAQALEKLPADRFDSAGKFAEALGNPQFTTPVRRAAGVKRHRSVGNKFWPASTALLGVTSAISISMQLTRSPEPAVPAGTFPSPFLADEAPLGEVHLSPDGNSAVFGLPNPEVGRDAYIRSWDRLNARPVPGASGIWGGPIRFSPDGTALAYVKGDGPNPPRQLRVSTLDGSEERIVVDEAFVVLHWSHDDYLYFAGALADERPLLRVPATGGEPEVVAERDGDWAPRNVTTIPNNSIALVQYRSLSLRMGDEIRSLDLDTGEEKRLVAGGSPHYSSTGHLVYLSEDGVLTAVPLSAARDTLAGAPSSLISGVSAFSLSASGTLLYRTGPTLRDPPYELVWVDRTGAATPVDSGWSFTLGGQPNSGWRLSPDETRIAYGAVTDGSRDIWVRNLSTDVDSRITTMSEDEWMPRWSPDGRMLVFQTDSAGNYRLATKRADGVGELSILFDDARVAMGMWSPDGEWLIIRQAGASVFGGEDLRDILAYRPGVDSTARPLIASPDFMEQAPALSPDGRWIAYVSNESGDQEVYVRPFPNVDAGKWQVSNGSGERPVWSSTGQELYYVASGPNRMTVVDVREQNGGLTFTNRTYLFEIGAEFVTTSNADYFDITDDSQRFLMARLYQPSNEQRIIVLVQNWAHQLNESDGR